MYTVTWKSTDDNTAGHQKQNLTEADKDRLIASLATDASAYCVEVLTD